MSLMKGVGHRLGEDFDKVQQNIQERVHHGLQDDINKVNTQSVKDALNKMKAMKSDALFDFSSDCLMNASNKLIDHVTTLFRWFLATGKIPDFLLLCTHISAQSEGQLR